MKILIVGSIILLFLFSISVLVGLFPLTSILSTMRGYFYLLLAFSIFKDKYISDINNVFYITLGSSIAWVLLGLMSFEMIITNIDSYRILVVYGNMMALTLMIAISIVFNKKKIQFVVLGITLIVSISAGLRRQIIVSFVAYLLSFLTQLKLSHKRIINLSLSLSIIIFTVITIYPVADEFVKDLSPVLHKRIFVKSEMLVRGDVGYSDQTRINSLSNFTSNIENYILPRGFVSKRTGTDKNTGIFVDSPYIELFHMLGIIFSIPLILYFFWMLYFHFKNYYKRKVTESAVCIVMGGVIIVLMLIESSFLNYPYITPLTGFVIARISSKRNLIK